MRINIKKLNIAQATKCFSNIELSQSANVGLQTITEIKNGKRTPTLKTIGKIARALNCDVTELIEQESDNR